MRISLTLRGAAVLLFASPAWAQLSITSLNSPVVINFDSTVAGVEKGAFQGLGFAPSPSTAGELDSNAWSVTGVNSGQSLAFGGTQTTSGPWARGPSPGGVLNTMGGIYAFNTSTTSTANWTLGIKPQGTTSANADFDPGNIILRIINNTGAAFDQLTVSYDIFMHNNESGADTIHFYYSPDNLTYTNVASYDFTTLPSSDSLGFVQSNHAATITGLNVASGASFYLKWNIVNGGTDANPKDEIGLDNITITPHSAPEPTGLLSMILMGLPWLARRHRRLSKS
jgi:hypothetical protein